MKRVVVTGMAGITALGDNAIDILENLKKYQNAIVKMTEWGKYQGLLTQVASPIPAFKEKEIYHRRQLRSMGRVAALATKSAEMALENAGLRTDQKIQDGRMGIAYGSSSGSPEALSHLMNTRFNHNIQGINANTYLRMMPQTTPVNMGVFLGLKGRIITTNSACTSGSQGIGYAYEAVKYGLQPMMLGGGAEELDITQAAVFDTLFATSCENNNKPQLTPRPFDKDRDGLVIGEGAATFVLEELEHAKARGAPILAEIVGFYTNSDGLHVTQPNAETMAIAIQGALDNAHLPASEIGYINAHGTATERGDIAESKATYAVFKDNTPISSLKSYIGHTLGACGAIESYISIEMMRHQWFCPTINLDQVADECAPLDYIQKQGREITTDYIMSNNFAFGGINTSLIFKNWH